WRSKVGSCALFADPRGAFRAAPPEAADRHLPRLSKPPPARPARTYASPSIAPIIPLLTDIPYTPGSSARIFRSITRHDAGCAWLTAPRAWTAPKIGAES